MIYVILGLSVLFIGIGFLVTKENAKYLLAGYNTMSDEERKKVNLEKYIPFFRKFHIYLGISFGVLGTLIHHFLGENVSGVFLGIYPILAYIVFIWEGRNYSIGKSTKWYKWSVFALVAVLIGVSILFYAGFKESGIVIDNQKIEIKGMYGKTILADEIAGIQLVERLPSIKYRSNGFALGMIKKGYFKTSNGEKVLLILNADQKPLILIERKAEPKLFYSSRKQSNQVIFESLKKNFPDLIKPF